MYSNHQNPRSSSVPGRKKRRETFTAKDTASISDSSNDSKGARRPRSVGRRTPVASPVGRRPTSVGRKPVQQATRQSMHSPPARQPVNTQPQPQPRRQPRVSVTSRSAEFRPRTVSPPAPAPRPSVCKPTAVAKPRASSRLSGFSLSCGTKGCDGGANCLHI